MRKLAVWAAALVFAAGAVALSPEAEARRRGGGVAAGIVAAALIGGIVAASVASSRRHYGYYPRTYGYRSSYGYATPYYGSAYAPVYSYRRAYRPSFSYRSYRPIGFSRAGFVGRRHWGGGRRWR